MSSLIGPVQLSYAVYITMCAQVALHHARVNGLVYVKMKHLIICFFLLQDVSIVMMRVKGRAIFGLLWLLNCLCCSQGEVYSSASDMMQVFGLERELVTIINGFANKLQGKLDRINSYLEVIHR